MQVRKLLTSSEPEREEQNAVSALEVIGEVDEHVAVVQQVLGTEFRLAR